MRRAELVRSISIAEVKLALGVPASDDLVIEDDGPLGVTLIRLVQLRQLRFVDVAAQAEKVKTRVVELRQPSNQSKTPTKTRVNARRRRGRK